MTNAGSSLLFFVPRSLFIRFDGTDDMAYWILHNTVSAAILALVALLICRWRPAQPALRHALWLVVLAKLVESRLPELPPETSRAEPAAKPEEAP